MDSIGVSDGSLDVEGVELSCEVLPVLIWDHSFGSEIGLVSHDTDLHSFVCSLSDDIHPIFYAWERVWIGKVEHDQCAEGFLIVTMD